jgi:hypothetical protein
MIAIHQDTEHGHGATLRVDAIYKSPEYHATSGSPTNIETIAPIARKVPKGNANHRAALRRHQRRR